MESSFFYKCKTHGIALNDVGVILHLGAGVCQEMSSFLEVSPEQIVLVEGEETLAKRLEKRYEDNNSITIINKAVICDQSIRRVDFVSAQPKQFSGVKSPNQFKSIFKNLKIVSTDKVPSITVDELILDLKVSPKKQNILVIQLNGYETDFINTLSSKALRYFGLIFVQCLRVSTNRDLDNDSASISEISIALKNMGFKLNHEQSFDPVFDNYCFVYDMQKEQLDRLNTELEAAKKALKRDGDKIRSLEADLVAQSETNNALLVKIENLATKEGELHEKISEISTTVKKVCKEKEDFSDLSQQLRKANNEQRSVFKEQLSTITSSHRSQIEELSIELKNSEANLKKSSIHGKSIEEKNSQLRSEITKRAEQEDTLLKKISVLEAELSKQTTLNGDIKSELQSMADSDHKLKKQNQTLQDEIRESSRDNTLGQKMLAKAHLDLAHLRRAYAEKVESENELVDLVKELREKLMLASKYYFKLQKEHPELLNSTESSEDTQS